VFQASAITVDELVANTLPTARLAFRYAARIAHPHMLFFDIDASALTVDQFVTEAFASTGLRFLYAMIIAVPQGLGVIGDAGSATVNEVLGTLPIARFGLGDTLVIAVVGKLWHAVIVAFVVG